MIKAVIIGFSHMHVNEVALYISEALEKRIVGEPIKLHYMNGHTGPLGKGAKHRGVTAKAEEMTDEQRSKTWWHQEKLGGGVFLDISCYGAFFTKWLMGDGEQAVLAYGAKSVYQLRMALPER